MAIARRKLRSLATPLLRGDSGGALLETALTAPMLLTLILGAAEFARVSYGAIEVTNAARAGVAYGSQNGGTASDSAGITWAATHDASNLPGLTVTNISLSYICSNGTASTGLNTDCANSHIEETVTVNTQVVMDPLIHLPGLPTTYTLKGQAVQKCLQ